MIKTALIGCGGISSMHIAALKKLDSLVRVVSVCDTNEERAKARAAELGCEYTLDWHDYLSDDAIEVVHILTPHYLHAPMAIALLNAGKRVLTEKPMASEVADAKKMIESADGRLAVVFQNRYNPASQIVKQAIDTKQYGELLSLNGLVMWQRGTDYYDTGEWRGRWDTEGGGVLINQAIHTLDLMLWFGGKPVSVRGKISTDKLYERIEVEDTAHIVIEFESGLSAPFYATNNAGHNRPVEIELKFEQATLRLKADTLYLEVDDEIQLLHKNVVTGDKGYWGQSHELLIADYYRCLHEGRPFWIDGNEAFTALAVLKGAYESSRKEQTILL